MSDLDQLFGARVAVIVPDVLEPARCAALRAALEPRYVRYPLLDRGSYDVAEPLQDAALFDELAARLAARVDPGPGRRYAITEARGLRLGPGDYALAHADRVHEGLPLELVLDVSAAAVPGAEVHYRRRGQVYFVFPSQPGALAIVERGPAVTCNHTYVSKRHAGAELVRLVLLARPVPLEAARRRGG